jgi:flagellar biogenesis protein FliO
MKNDFTANTIKRFCSSVSEPSAKKHSVQNLPSVTLGTRHSVYVALIQLSITVGVG